MQFKVPQFLDIEDKIFGRFTFKEGVYLAGGGGLCFVIYRLLGWFWGFIPMLVVGGLAILLTFYKPNNKPFIHMLEAGFKFLIQDKLFIWKRKQGATAKERMETKEEVLQTNGGAKLYSAKLRDLAWSLDVLDLKKQEEGR